MEEDFFADMGSDDPFADIPVSRGAQKRKEYAEMPWWSQLGTAADDVVRLGADGITFGYGDKLSAYLNSLGGTDEDYNKALDAERLATYDARERAGSAGIAAEVGGNIATASLLPGLAVAKPAGAVSRFGLSLGTGAAEGAGMGYLSALGHDSDTSEGVSTGAIAGLAGGAAAPIATSVLGKGLGVFDKVTKRRSVDELRAAKDAAYDAPAFDAAAYHNGAANRLVGDLRGAAQRDNINPLRHPNASSVLDDIDSVIQNGGPLSARTLDQLRQVAERDIGGGEAHFRTLIKNGIDDFQANATMNDMARGSVSPMDAFDAVTAARSANRTYAKSKQVQEALEKNANAKVDSGGENQLRTLLNNPNEMRGYKPDEKAAMTEAVRGTQLNRAADTLGRVIPRSPVGGMVIGGALGAMGSPLLGTAVGLGVPALGMAARGIANSQTKKSVNKLLDTIDGKAGRVKSGVRNFVEGQADNLRRAVPGLSLSSDPLAKSREELERRRRGD